MQGGSSSNCLSRLNDLLQRVQRKVQARKQDNSLASYRIGFEITQPSLLLGGTMQPHQLEALEWMVNLTSQSSNAILADDMGLGKTIQAIAYFAYLKEEHGVTGKHLVLCPKSVCMNWMREIKKWFPSANVQLLLATQAEREEMLQRVVRPRKFDILVTTYEGAKNCLGVLRRVQWEVLVVDEAHKIKNSQSENFICLSMLRASFKLLLTGTPLSNNLRELWSLLNFIMPDLFQNESLFNEIQDSADQLQGTEQQKFAYQCKIAATFHKIIGPFFKRRTKKTLELGLPEKIEKTLYVPLSAVQLQCYKNYLKYGSVEGPGGKRNYHIMWPRKICLHPYLLDFVREREEEEEEREGWSAEEAGRRLIDSSGKLKILDKLLHKLIGEKHKVLIFSQFTMLLDVLETYCMFRSYRYCRIDGGTSIEQRDREMETFNGSEEYPIFLLSTRAGGLGINLVSADTVIIYDIDWNPQNDIQAMDRAYRMGQTRTVHVYKLITEHTIEERMLEFQKYKLIWDELVIQKGGFVGKNKREDPFSNVNLNQLAMLGKGDIFKLEADQSDQNIEVVLQMGERKERMQDEAIRKKLAENMEKNHFNPFQEEDEPETIEEMERYESDIVVRRNYEHEKRHRLKFDRIYVLPAFKFYVKGHKIKQLEFQLFMTYKQERPNSKLIASIKQELQAAKSSGLFEHWSEEEYRLFLEAHQSCERSDYDGISAYVGTKSASEVMEYSNVFFQKAPNNERLIADLGAVNVAQARYRKEIAKEKAKEREEVKLKEAEEKKAREMAREEAARMKEEIAKKREEDKRLKQEAKSKKAEQLRLREQTKRMKQQQKKKKAQQRELMLEQRKARKQKQEAEEKAKRERLEELQLRRKADDIRNRDLRRQSVERIRQEFERKKKEAESSKVEVTQWNKAEDAQTSCTDKDSRDKREVSTPTDSKALPL